MAAIPLCGIGRSDLGGKQTWRPDHAKRDCSPEIRHCAEVAAQRVVWKADLFLTWGRPMIGGKKRVHAPPDAPG